MLSHEQDKIHEAIQCCFKENCKENNKAHARALTLMKVLLKRSVQYAQVIL